MQSGETLALRAAPQWRGMNGLRSLCAPNSAREGRHQKRRSTHGEAFRKVMSIDPGVAITRGLVLLSQGGSAGTDEVRAIVAGPDDTVTLAGVTDGNWTGTNVGDSDFAALRAPASFFSGTVRAPQGDDDDDDDGPSLGNVGLGVILVVITFICGLWYINYRTKLQNRLLLQDLDAAVAAATASSGTAVTEDEHFQGVEQMTPRVGRSPARITSRRARSSGDTGYGRGRHGGGGGGASGFPAHAGRSRA